MLETKYITIINTGYAGGIEDIIVFSSFLQHKDVRENQLRGMEILGAGFIYFDGDSDGCVTCECYGKSLSLGIESRTEDTTIANDRLL